MLKYSGLRIWKVGKSDPQSLPIVKFYPKPDSVHSNLIKEIDALCFISNHTFKDSFFKRKVTLRKLAYFIRIQLHFLIYLNSKFTFTYLKDLKLLNDNTLIYCETIINKLTYIIIYFKKFFAMDIKGVWAATLNTFISY